MLALGNDGKVWAWGKNRDRIIDSTKYNILLPTHVQGVRDTKIIKAYRDDGIIAIRKDGTVWTWGYNTFILETVAHYSKKPVQIFGISNVKNVYSSNCTRYLEFVKKDDSIWGIQKSINFESDTSGNVYKYSVHNSRAADFIKLIEFKEYKDTVSISYGTGKRQQPVRAVG